MSDITERLRYTARIRGHARLEPDLVLNECLEAADEIDRLRAALRRIDKMEVYSEDARDVLHAKLGIMRDIARAALEEKA